MKREFHPFSIFVLLIALLLSNCTQQDKDCSEEQKYLQFRIYNYERLFNVMQQLEGREYVFSKDVHTEMPFERSANKYTLVYHCTNVDYSKFEENYGLLLDVKENLADTAFQVVLITSFQNYRLIKPRLNKKVKVGYVDRLLDNDSTGLFKQAFICMVDKKNKIHQPFFMDQMTTENIASYFNTVAQRYAEVPGYRFVKQSQAVITDKNQNIKVPKIDVELSNTHFSRQLGLMYRESLPENASMLFVFDPPTKVAFWMKNTVLPLDIVYLNDKNEITEIFTDVKPFSTEMLHSKDDVSFVYEFNAGFIKRNSIVMGDIIKVKNPELSENSEN